MKSSFSFVVRMHLFCACVCVRLCVQFCFMCVQFCFFVRDPVYNLFVLFGNAFVLCMCACVNFLMCM